MNYSTCSYKQIFILLAAVYSLLLCTHVFADDSSNGQAQQRAYTFDFGPAISVSNEGLDVSLGFTYYNKDDMDFMIERSSIAYQMDPSGVMGLNESPRPGGTSRLFKWALKEYKFLHGVRELVEDVEERVERYEKKVKLKGEFAFSEEKSPNMAGGENRKFRAGLNLGEDRTFKSWLFSNKFVPRTFKWRFTADPTDETVGGRFFIGEYLTLEGNAGLNENSNVFLMFRYTF
jgi:hypothetical protein